MHALLGVAESGLSAVFLSPLRSIATAACLVAVLLPYFVGSAISFGIEREADIAVQASADLNVTGSQFGREAPVPLSVIPELERIEGVREVVPRIVGTIGMGAHGESAVIVGLPPEHFPATITCIEGRLPRAGTLNELVVGTELARRLNLHIGDRLPPFYHNRGGEKLAEIVGLFRSELSLWQSRMMLTTFDSAAAIFDQPGLATDLLVNCRAGYQDEIQRVIGQFLMRGPPSAPVLRLRAVSRQDLAAIVPRGLLHREGIFNVLFVVAFAVAILAIAVTSGFGLSGRRREVGILKATGWQTDELLLRAGMESFAIVVAGFTLSLLLAYIWLAVFNGFGVAGIFLSGAGIQPSFRVPFQLAPVPALLGSIVSFVVVMSGTLFSTWRAAIAPPLVAIRGGGQ